MSDHQHGQDDDAGGPPPFSPPGGSPPPPPPPADAPPAPGWWKASDGNWYPPQQQPQQQPHQPPPPGGAGQWTPPPVGGAYGTQSAPGGGVYYSPQTPQQQGNGIATWALVLGILSILGFWTFGLGVFLGILAVIFGIMGRNRAREAPGTPNEGRAQAGLITGILGIVGGLAFIAWALTFVDDVVDEIEHQLDDGICEPETGLDPDC